MITHGNAATFVGWALGAFGQAELARVLASTSVCFDLSVFELFVPLSAGGTVVMVRDALQLADAGGDGCTLINTIPSAMAELLRLGAVPPTVRAVNLAGEALPRRLVEEISRLTADPAPRVVNLYGPTEDTTYSTVAVVPPGDDSPPPIGRPIASTRVYLLDPHLRPVPPGAVGDLYLGGSGLARGYLGQPALTAERFLPDPFAATAGERLYRTGDLCRFRPDGSLLYLGRSDHQVKVRGYRVEPQEIEAALGEHPGVEEAVVVARDQRLVAYLVARDQATPEAADLQAFLRARLPEYMVPSTFVALEALPRTANGKVDRKGLPAGRPLAPARAEHVGPRTPVEEEIAAIFASVLGLECVGVHDDFFELGGHSLLATQVVSRIHDTLGAGVSLSAFFQAPTVAGLAKALAGDPYRPADEGRSDVEALLAEIETLSDEQARAELARLDPGSRTRRDYEPTA
jgi:acyl-coenzyme A synthetase/AMP-(fatty) acid ligase/acyl carrier protein